VRASIVAIWGFSGGKSCFVRGGCGGEETGFVIFSGQLEEVVGSRLCYCDLLSGGSCASGCSKHPARLASVFGPCGVQTEHVQDALARKGLNRPVLKHGPRSLTSVRVFWFVANHVFDNAK